MLLDKKIDILKANGYVPLTEISLINFENEDICFRIINSAKELRNKGKEPILVLFCRNDFSIYTRGYIESTRIEDLLNNNKNWMQYASKNSLD